MNGCDEMGNGLICRGIIPPANQRIIFLVGLLHPGTGTVLIHVITARMLPYLELKGREEGKKKKRFGNRRFCYKFRKLSYNRYILYRLEKKNSVMMLRVPAGQYRHPHLNSVNEGSYSPIP